MNTEIHCQGGFVEWKGIRYKKMTGWRVMGKLLFCFVTYLLPKDIFGM